MLIYVYICIKRLLQNDNDGVDDYDYDRLFSYINVVFFYGGKNVS